MNESAVIFRPLPQPPAPRISEEEITRVTRMIAFNYVTGCAPDSESFKHYEAEIAAILRTLNEEKKA